MYLQKENSQLKKDLATAKEELQAITETTDVAFENCSISIEYKNSQGKYGPRYGTVTKDLTELFKIIAMQMLDVSISENNIDKILCRKLFGDSYSHSFSDPQFVKQILNQFKEAGLIYSSWDNQSSTLFWGLTKKGKLVRNDMLLLKRKNE